MTAELTFARPELLSVLPQIDTNRDGVMTGQEVSSVLPLLEQTIVQGVVVHTSAESCGGTLQSAALTEADGLSIHAVYRCPTKPEVLSLTLPFLASLSHGHRHLVTASANTTSFQSVAYVGNATFDLSLPRDSHGENARPGAQAWSFFCLGIEHILTGYDHLVFLLGLILIGGQLRCLLQVVTAFTVAHSLTLGLAVLGVWAPSPVLVEPMIALSIVYVGIENYFIQDARRRWLITFPFGLIHGFGFAGVLQEITLPQGQIPLALVSFNIGVEVGQLAVLMGVLPIVRWLRQQTWFTPQGMQVANAGIIVAGTWWFLSRIA